jgi:hypothetical protein
MSCSPNHLVDCVLMLVLGSRLRSTRENSLARSVGAKTSLGKNDLSLFYIAFSDAVRRETRGTNRRMASATRRLQVAAKFGGMQISEAQRLRELGRRTPSSITCFGYRCIHSPLASLRHCINRPNEVGFMAA